MIYNETVNAARLALISAIKELQEWDDTLSDRSALTLLMAVADIEGVPPRSPTRWHDIELYDEVRRRLS